MLATGLVVIKTFLPSIVENIAKKFLLGQPNIAILSLEDGPAVIANSLTEEFKQVIDVLAPNFEVPIDSIINLIAYEITKFLMGKKMDLKDSLEFLLSVEASKYIFEIVMDKMVNSELQPLEN